MNDAMLKCQLAEQVLRSFGKVRVKVLGSSMLPSVWPGDIVTICSQEASAVRPLDIVAFMRDGRIYVHRAIGKTGQVLVTRGDALAHNDAPVCAGEILGRVVSIQRGWSRLIPLRLHRLRQRLSALKRFAKGTHGCNETRGV